MQLKLKRKSTTSDKNKSQQKSKGDIFCRFFSSVANNRKHKTIELCNFTRRKLKSNYEPPQSLNFEL